jgi:hypothetical protein
MTANRDPTPAEIAQRCAEIQSGWTEAERLKRLRSDLRPTYTRCDGESEEMTADNYNGHHGQRAELQAMAGG